MLKLTSELIKSLKKRKKVKGNIMKAALTMEKFGMEALRTHEFKILSTSLHNAVYADVKGIWFQKAKW